MSNKGTIKFNVGGTRYEVARSLLGSHPDMMISRMISEEWQQSNDGNGEVYIERDGARFKYLLDYLRDGKVNLPLKVSKKAVIDDLKYYGVDPEDRIYYDNVEAQDVNSLFLNTMTSSEKALGNLVEEENEMSEEIKQVERTLQELKDQETGVNQKLGVISSPKRFRITEGEMFVGKITLR